MKSGIVISLVTFAGLSVLASPQKKIDFQPEVKMSVSELLSLPSENRLLVAKSRGTGFLPELEKIAFTKNEEFDRRWKALTLSAQIRGVKSEVLLKKALQAPEWFMRNAALLAYQEILPQKTKLVAEDLLKDKALVVRSAAVQVLSSSMDASVRELFWSELESPKNFRKKQSLYIRSQILASLAEDPLSRELPLFVKHLQENDSRLHGPSIIALERLTSKSFGKKADAIDKKRNLWIKWAASKPSSTLLQ